MTSSSEVEKCRPRDVRELTLSSGQSPPKNRVAKAAGTSRNHGHCGFWGLPSFHASHICSYGHTGRALREEFQMVTAACLGAQSCPADKKPKAQGLASQVLTRLCLWSEWIPVAVAPTNASRLRPCLHNPTDLRGSFSKGSFTGSRSSGR